MRFRVGDSRTIELVQGDITRQEVDAIVNAANSSLLGGGGVDGAIHRAGGPAILEECRQIRATSGPLPPGKAVATTAGRLGARYVIHTVGPIWSGGHQGEAETLGSCYRAALGIADEFGLSSVAFPAISTGAYGYPVDEAARVAVGAVTAGVESASSIRDIRFVLFDAETLRAFEAAARSLLGEE